MTRALHRTWMFVGINLKVVGKEESFFLKYIKVVKGQNSDFIQKIRKSFSPSTSFQPHFSQVSGLLASLKSYTKPSSVPYKMIIGPGNPGKTSFRTFSLCVFLKVIF